MGKNAGGGKMTATLEKPDIVSVIEKEGVELRQRGQYWWALCPFHSEKTPSFFVSPERQKFKCFGCGAGGDVVDFVMKSHKISFADALQFLGLPGGVVNGKSNPQENKRRERIKGFREWCTNYAKWLAGILWLCNRIDALVTVPGQLETKGIDRVYQKRSIYEYHLDILGGNNIEAKFLVFREVIGYGQ